MGAGGGEWAAVRAELRRPGLSGGGGFSVDIGGGDGAGRDTGGATAVAAATETTADFFTASLEASLESFAGAAGNLATVVLPTGLTSDFTAAFKEGLAEGFLTALPEDVGAVGAAETTFFAVFTVAGFAPEPFKADAAATDFFAASFWVGSTTAGNFFSRDFTMCFLWNAAYALAAGCFQRELSPDSSAALMAGHPICWLELFARTDTGWRRGAIVATV